MEMIEFDYSSPMRIRPIIKKLGLIRKVVTIVNIEEISNDLTDNVKFCRLHEVPNGPGDLDRQWD